MRLEPGRRGAAHAPSLLAIDGADAAAVRLARALLHLDEHELPAAPGDQVDLVAAGADVGAEDPVAAEPVVPRREPLAAVHAATGPAYARAWNERRCCGHGPCATTARV